jgi:hypothetical protein
MSLQNQLYSMAYPYLNTISVPNLGTLGNLECAVRLENPFQHIYFLKVCIWRESWCLLGVLSSNKPQNENEQYTISFQQSPTISGL